MDMVDPGGHWFVPKKISQSSLIKWNYFAHLEIVRKHKYFEDPFCFLCLRTRSLSFLDLILGRHAEHLAKVLLNGTPTMLGTDNSTTLLEFPWIPSPHACAIGTLHSPDLAKDFLRSPGVKWKDGSVTSKAFPNMVIAMAMYLYVIICKQCITV